MRCGPAFNAHIHSHEGKEFYTTLNSSALAVQNDLVRAQAAVEEKIINSVRAMLPAYKVIFERAKRRARTKADSQPNGLGSTTVAN